LQTDLDKLPEKQFVAKITENNRGLWNSDVGIDPVKALLFSITVVILDVSLKILSGRVPVNKLCDISNSSNFFNFEIDDGILPVSKLPSK
jgi:hypothetical protein